jgi:hypothetical protein
LFIDAIGPSVPVLPGKYSMQEISSDTEIFSPIDARRVGALARYDSGVIVRRLFGPPDSVSFVKDAASERQVASQGV